MVRKACFYACSALSGAVIAAAAPAQTPQLPPAADAQATQAVPTTTPPPAIPEAAPSPEPTDQLQDIVVTARKTTENLQKAPASIVAVSGAELVSRGAVDLQSLEKFLPSANLRRQGPVTEVFIRGIGTRIDLPNFANASAFVYNGLVIQRYGTFGLLYDLDSVQSIAGPQGTLYGGSGAGGAINLFSARPHNDFSGYAEVEGGDYGTFEGTVAQNIAVASNLSLRGAFQYNRRDAYYSDDINSQKNYSGRLSALYKPIDDVTINMFYNHGRDSGRPIVTLVTVPFLDPDHPYQLPSVGAAGNPINGRYTYQDNRNDIVGANVEIHAGANTFTYIPGYVNFVANYLTYTANAGNMLQVYDRERQHSEELRWNRQFGALQLTAGFFYLRNLTDFNDALHKFVSPTLFVPIPLNRTNQVNDSVAGYAQGIYSLTDKLRLTAGGRFSRDKIDAAGAGSGGVPIDYHHSHGHWDYKVGLDYDLARSVLIYGVVQTSYIPFGYNPDVAPRPTVPESRLFALSGGFKSRFLDNRLELNVEGFSYDYKNFQAVAFVAATGLSTVLNADKAKIYGADISLRASITPTTKLDAGVVLEHARYTDFAGLGYNYSGNRMIYAPSVNIVGGIGQDILLGVHGKLNARVDNHYSGSYFGNFNNFPNSKQGAFVKTDVALTYSPPNERWSVQGFVRNLENKAVFTTLSPGATPAATGTAGLEAPRTFGAQVRITW